MLSNIERVHVTSPFEHSVGVYMPEPAISEPPSVVAHCET
jgi:hypothetical protein